MDNSSPIVSSSTPSTLDKVQAFLLKEEAKKHTYFVFGEDLVSALIGPFPSREAAEAHIQFCIDRGDGAHHEVVSEFIATRMDERHIGYRCTPEEDRAEII